MNGSPSAMRSELFGECHKVMDFRKWPGGATPVRRGDRFLGSTRRREGRGRTVAVRISSPASAIEVSSAVPTTNLGGADCRVGPGNFTPSLSQIRT
jgi:hypothetical protein